MSERDSITVLSDLKHLIELSIKDCSLRNYVMDVVCKACNTFQNSEKLHQYEVTDLQGGEVMMKVWFSPVADDYAFLKVAYDPESIVADLCADMVDTRKDKSNPLSCGNCHLRESRRVRCGFEMGRGSYCIVTDENLSLVSGGKRGSLCPAVKARVPA